MVVVVVLDVGVPQLLLLLLLLIMVVVVVALRASGLLVGFLTTPVEKIAVASNHLRSPRRDLDGRKKVNGFVEGVDHEGRRRGRNHPHSVGPGGGRVMGPSIAGLLREITTVTNRFETERGST